MVPQFISIVVGWMAIAVVVGTMTAQRYVLGDKPIPPSQRLAPPPEVVVIGPPLPSDEQEQKCVRDIAKAHNLVLTEAGWRAPTEVPEPKFSPTDNEGNKAALIAWVQAMHKYIHDVVEPDWVQCKTAKRAEGAKPRPKPKPTGSYNIEFSDSSSCGSLKRTQIGITETANTSGKGDPLFLVEFA